MDVDGYSVSIYGTYYVLKKFYIDGITSFGWNAYDSIREIDYPFADSSGNPRWVDQTAKGDTDGTYYSLSFGAGYDFNIDGHTFGPYGRVNYLEADIDGYRESVTKNPRDTGEAGENLDIESQDVKSLTTVLGGQASYAISTRWAVLVPHARIEWEHEYENNSRQLNASFVNDPGKTPIIIPTDDPDRDFFNIGVGMSAVFAHGKSAFVYYETVLGLDYVTAHNIAVGVRFEL